MTIECYYKWCKYHSIHDEEDEGPFCFEQECRATPAELNSFAILRRQELDQINKESTMLKEQYDLQNEGEELLILQDLEAHYRDQVQVLLTEGKDDEALKWDEMANEVADRIEQLKH